MLTSNHDALIQILLHQTIWPNWTYHKQLNPLLIMFVKTLKSQHWTVGKNQGCILVEYIYWLVYLLQFQLLYLHFVREVEWQLQWDLIV